MDHPVRGRAVYAAHRGDIVIDHVRLIDLPCTIEFRLFTNIA